MEKRLIKISNNKIFLTPEMGLDFKQTSLREGDLKFKTAEDIYFEVEAPNYDQNAGSILLHVTDYQPKNTGKFKEQKATAPVNFIHFKPFLWHEIEKYLYVYTHAKLLRLGIVVGREIYQDRPNTNYNRLETLKGNGGHYDGASIPSFHVPGVTHEKTITETGKVYFKDADFNDGYVAFDFKSKERKQTFSLKIENSYLLKEFNEIKNYFPKVFEGRKQFNFSTTYSVLFGSASDFITKSEEIAAIDENIIERIKNETVATLTTAPIRNVPDRSIFTDDEIFDNFQEGGNILKQSEEEILNRIIEIKKVRNSKQLQFLSGAKQSSNQKLRFTLKPLFGFLFFIEGKNKNHFCWELLDSHATYLWSFDRLETEADHQFRKVEQIITIIKDIGREAYKKNQRSGILEKGFSFSTVEHSNINSFIADAFVNWQQRLEQKLI